MNQVREFIKNHFAHISITVIAILLTVMYFYPEIQWIRPYAIWTMIIYGGMLVISIFFGWIINLLSVLLINHKDSMDNDVVKSLSIALATIYATLSKKEGLSYYYTPILSLFVVFLSGSLGFWLFAVLEGYSEYLNIRLVEKSKNYIDYARKIRDEQQQ